MGVVSESSTSSALLFGGQTPNLVSTKKKSNGLRTKMLRKV